MLRFALFLLLIPATAAAELAPILDLRARQEFLDGAFHFAPETDRNWIRVRTRGGFSYGAGDHALTLRLNNEHRHMLTPDQELNWDEVIIDRLQWRWSIDEERALTAGRQDIIWPGGFLMLEGHPLDGSRSIFHNAVRFQWDGLDVAGIFNPKYDDLVLIDDQGRPLSDMDEAGGYLRWVHGGWAWSLIGKFETDPDEVLDDLTTMTGSARYESTLANAGTWHLDLAAQWQDGRVRSAVNDQATSGTGRAWAGEGAIVHPFAGRWAAEAGGFWYSGFGDGARPFRLPWGRWPRWSEMYIYTLIGESTPGRIHVAAWEDIAAPRLGLRVALADRLDGRVFASYLFSPVHGEGRGLLTEVKLTGDLGHRLSAHLLWEMLEPGPFHDGRHGLPRIEDRIHLLRWEISWAL
jgi:hypothetical protein